MYYLHSKDNKENQFDSFIRKLLMFQDIQIHDIQNDLNDTFRKRKS